jgi:Ca2+-binding RTX toxin-like protein
MAQFTGTSANDTLVGSGGADLLIGAGGNDSLEGGGGNDTAVFSGKWSDYRFDAVAGVLRIIDLNPADGNDGTDLLRNIWQLQFADRIVTLGRGGEIRANTSIIGMRADPAIAALAGEGFVVTWTSSQDGISDSVFGQRFNASGQASGKEFRVNTTAGSTRHDSEVAGLADGGFVVVWASIDQDAPENWGIYARRYAADGSAQGSEFSVVSAPLYQQVQPEVAATADGGFIISWTSVAQAPGTTYATFARKFAANGSPLGEEFRVGPLDTSDRIDASFVTLADGTLAAVWTALDSGGSTGVFTRLYGADGSASGPVRLVNTTLGGNQSEAAVVALAGGGYLVAWKGDSAANAADTDAFARFFSETGEPIGAEFRLDSGGGAQSRVTIAPLTGGGFVATWMDTYWPAPHSGPTSAVFARVFDAAGNPAAREFRLAPDSAATGQLEPVAVAMAGGGFAVFWRAAESGSLGSSSIFGQFFDAAGQRILPVVTGTNRNDRIDIGGSGAMEAVGGKGSDIYVVGNVNDRVVERSDQGHDEIRSTVSYVLPRHVEVLTLLGNASIDGTGNNGNEYISGNAGNNLLAGLHGNDTLTGGAGNDTLDGGAGNDLMIGGTGDDTYMVNSVDDQIIELAGAGNDAVFSRISHELGDNLENLTLVGTVLRGTGNSLDNRITGSAVGNHLRGGAGNDTLDGGGGDDIAFYEGLRADFRLGTINGHLIVQDRNPGDGDEGRDLLREIWTLRFADGDLAIRPGGITRLESDPGFQPVSTVAALADGGYIALWSSMSPQGNAEGIRAQRFAADGRLLGDAFEITGNPEVLGAAAQATVLSDGGFVVAWETATSSAGDREIMLRRFDADGNATGEAWRLDPQVAGSSSAPALAAFADGGFLLSWTQTSADRMSSQMLAQRFDEHASKAGSAFGPGAAGGSVQHQGVVSVLSNGSAVLAWQSGGYDGVLVQRHDASGSAGPVLTLNPPGAFHVTPAIAALDDGGFIIAWSAYSSAGTARIMGQRFDAAGQLSGAIFSVSSGVSGNFIDPEVSSVPGGFVVSWAQRNGAAMLRRFDNGGNPQGDVFELDSLGVDGYGNAAAFTAALTGGGFVLAWNETDGGRSLRFDAVARPILPEVRGGSGDDVLDIGGGGAMSAAGGSGNDTYHVASQAARVIEAANGGHDRVFASSSFVLPANVEELALVGSAHINATGGIGNDVLTGNAGNNQLTGRGGRDTLIGGNGDDTLDGGPGADRMEGGPGNDTYHINASVDLIIELADGGIDTVIAPISYELPEYLENLVLTDNALSGTGNASANLIRGNAAANTLNGGGGDDTLEGGGGADIAVFSGSRNEYRFGLVDGGLLVQDMEPANGDDGTDLLRGISRFRFADGELEVLTHGLQPNGLPPGDYHQELELAVLASGGVIAVWEASSPSSAAWAQLHTSTGQPVGAPFRLDSDRDTSHWTPQLTALAGGGFVTTWQSRDNGAYTVVARRFDADARPLANQVRISAPSNLSDFSQPAITALDSGAYVISWIAVAKGSHATQIQAQRFEATGSPAAARFKVNTTGFVSSDAAPALSGLKDGGFVAIWNVELETGVWLRAQRYGADGAATGTEITLNASSIPYVQTPAIAALAGGGFVTAWTGGSSLDRDIHMQRFDAAGNPLAAVQIANQATRLNQSHPQAFALPDGGFVVVWRTDSNVAGASNTRARFFDADGSPRGDEFATFENFSVAAARPDGGLVTAAISFDGLRGRDYDADLQPMWPELRGSAGDDRIDVAGPGAMRAVGLGGNDTYVIASGDVVVERPGEGYDTVMSLVSYTLPANVEKLVLLGNANINGSAGAGAQLLEGNTGANRLDGGAGNDTLNGGFGNDTLHGGTGADQFRFDSVLSATGNVDLIADFDPAIDRIVLDDDIFTALDASVRTTLAANQILAAPGAVAATDSRHRIIHDTASGTLYYDADGTGEIAPVPFAVLGTTQHPVTDRTSYIIVD